jgi:hypothetical protein
MRKAILAIGSALLFALGVGVGMLWSRNDISNVRNSEEVHSRILEKGNMPSKKWPKALAAFTPDAIENDPALSEEALKRLTWEHLSELVLAKDILDERLRLPTISRPTSVKKNRSGSSRRRNWQRCGSRKSSPIRLSKSNDNTPQPWKQ